jgi:hypothetical protein
MWAEAEPLSLDIILIRLFQRNGAVFVAADKRSRVVRTPVKRHIATMGADSVAILEAHLV